MGSSGRLNSSSQAFVNPCCFSSASRAIFSTWSPWFFGDGEEARGKFRKEKAELATEIHKENKTQKKKASLGQGSKPVVNPKASKLHYST